MTDSPNFISFSAEKTANIRYEGLSVLIIDKEEEVRHGLTQVLSDFFSVVSSATNLQEAEALRNEQYFDIVLLDIDFPERSGIEWYQMLKNKSNDSDESCIIFMASYGELNTAIKAMKVGACDFIIKPFSIEKIINAVQSCAAKTMARKIRLALAQQTEPVPVPYKGKQNNPANESIPSANPSGNSSVNISASMPEYDEPSYHGYPNEWTLKDVEKAHILQVVNHYDGNKSAAAKVLGVARKTLERKFKDWDI